MRPTTPEPSQLPPGCGVAFALVTVTCLVIIMVAATAALVRWML